MRREAVGFALSGYFQQDADSLYAVLSLRGFTGQHQAGGAVKAGIVDIRHLRAGGNGGVDHALQQMGHHQKVLSGCAALGGDLFLGAGQIVQAQVAAQVAPGDDYLVAAGQKLVQMLHYRRKAFI